MDEESRKLKVIVMVMSVCLIVIADLSALEFLKARLQRPAHYELLNPHQQQSTPARSNRIHYPLVI